MLLGYEHRKEVIEIMRGFRPDIVICPHPMEYGRLDHVDAGMFAIRCVDYVRADGFDSPLAPHTVKQIYMFHYQGYRPETLAGPRASYRQGRRRHRTGCAQEEGR